MSSQQHNGHAAGSPPPSPTQVRKGIFEELTDTEISEGSKDVLRNLISKDLVLAYLTEAEVNEVKWHIRVVKELYLTLHPPQDCEISGGDRAAINDDPTDTLHPLTEEERVNVETFFMTVQSRVTRARDMKQQEMTRTQIAEHRDNTEDNESGGLLGRIRS